MASSAALSGHFLETLKERVFTSATRKTKMALSEEKFCRGRYRNHG